MINNVSTFDSITTFSLTFTGDAILHIWRSRSSSAAPAPAVSSWLRLQTAAAALQRLMLRGWRELLHARERAGAGFGSDAMRDGVQEGGGRARGLRLLVAACCAFLVFARAEKESAGFWVCF